MRKVIQLVAVDRWLTALCDDGAIFHLDNNVWQAVPPIPQPEPSGASPDAVAAYFNDGDDGDGWDDGLSDDWDEGDGDYDFGDDEDDYGQPVGSCENCDTNLYAYDDLEFCDQCFVVDGRVR